ncbi:redoxin family protein [Pseudodesulfovibrio sp. JC047]|nr:redoxin family protein [Pseudodesulfovibrio sp. JC047]
MAQLRQESSLLEGMNMVVMVIGPESHDAFKAYWEKERLPFIGLADPTHAVLQLYNQQIKFLKLGRMPAQMMVDPDGNLQFIHYGNSMADIPSLAEIETVLSR